MNLWNLITRFGDSSLLLPCALLIYGWLLYRREGGDAHRAARLTRGVQHGRRDARARGLDVALITAADGGVPPQHTEDAP